MGGLAVLLDRLPGSGYKSPSHAWTTGETFSGALLPVYESRITVNINPSRCTIIPNVQIAVVEDDQLVRDFVVDAFEFSINRKIHTFDSGFAAWQVIQSSQPIHIVFADIHVPDMDGLELTARIKTKRPDVVCILASGNAADEVLAKRAGADAFLLKPYGVNDLFSLVQTFVAAEGDRPERSLRDSGR